MFEVLPHGFSQKQLNNEARQGNEANISLLLDNGANIDGIYKVLKRLW